MKLKRRTGQEWIDERFIPVHGEKYNYSSIIDIEWLKSKSKITIGCNTNKDHPQFEQSVHNHVVGDGCPKCWQEKNSRFSDHNKNLFLSDAEDIFGNTYDYSKVNYCGYDIPVIIGCSLHGDFNKAPNEHISQEQGCPICGIIEKKRKLSFTLEEAISLANEVHDNKYDYSLNTKYYNSHERAFILCNKHGEFTTKWCTHHRGSICPSCSVHSSAIEIKLLDELKKIPNISITHQHKVGKIDIVINEKIGIEVNGMYWHSTKQKNDKEYHLKKTVLAANNGIQIIHLNEQELNVNFEKCFSLILSKLNIFSDVLYARKCHIKLVSFIEAKQFLEDNHMQGGRSIGSVRYGLFNDEKLISIMTFGKPRFGSNTEWELIRYCTKINTKIIGGASRLLQYFKKNNKGSIISYANRRWSDGNLYNILGFSLSHISVPSYEWVSTKHTYSRYQTQKHKLYGLLGDRFDKSKTEIENMDSAGFYQIFDCGNLVFILDK